MAYYITRHDAMAAAVATANAVETGIDGSASGAVRVPTGVSKIEQIGVGLSASIVAVASTGVTVAVRLTGPGLRDGQQDIPMAYLREDTTSTGGSTIGPAYFFDVDIAVKAGNDISIQAFANGVDPGTPEIDVCLVMA